MREARKEWHLGEIELGMRGFVEVEGEEEEEAAAAEVERFAEPVWERASRISQFFSSNPKSVAPFLDAAITFDSMIRPLSKSKCRGKKVERFSLDH